MTTQVPEGRPIFAHGLATERTSEYKAQRGGTMFGSHKVKIEGELLDKVKQCSDAAGYESVDEFVIHMLEKEIKKIMPPEESNTSKEDVQKRLRGLGYIE